MSIKLRYPDQRDAEWMLRQEKTPDAKAYSEYDEDYTLEDIKNFIDQNRVASDPSQTRLIIEVEGKPAGMVDLTGISPRNGHADMGIFIAKEYRRKGIGTEAVREATQFAAMMGIVNIKVLISAKHESSKGLYEKCGFQKIGELPGWLKQGSETAYIYYLSIMGETRDLEREAAEAAMNEFSLYGLNEEDPYAAAYLSEQGYGTDRDLYDGRDEYGEDRFTSLDDLDSDLY